MAQKQKQIQEKKEKKINKVKLYFEYKELVKLFNKVESDQTLKKYKILSKAYAIGKLLYEHKYSIPVLCKHFDLKFTTAKRILSLDRANERTWKLIKSGKLSAFKAAYILLTKDSKKQDEVIDYVLTHKLSVYKIKSRIRTRKTIEEKESSNGLLKMDDSEAKEYLGIGEKFSILEKEKEAVDKGYYTKYKLWKSFSNKLERFNMMLDIKIDTIPEDKVDILVERLNELKQKIDKFLNDINSMKGGNKN
jgi:hypothetical protein